MISTAYRDWKLSGAPFGRGVLLYHEHGPSVAIKKVLAMGENTYTIAKLDEALRGVFEKEVPEKNYTSITPPPVIPAAVDIDPLVGPIETRLKKLYTDQSNLHSQLKVSRSVSKRKRLAFEIMDLGKAIRTEQGSIKYIKTNGAAPPSTDINIDDLNDRAELKKKQLANRSYLSKNRHRTEPERVAEVERRRHENEEIEKLLADGC